MVANRILDVIELLIVTLLVIYFPLRLMEREDAWLNWVLLVLTVLLALKLARLFTSRN